MRGPGAARPGGGRGSRGSRGRGRGVLLEGAEGEVAEAPGKRPKAYSTRYSQAVSHPSTNQARPCLASEIRRDRARSGWYGRRRQRLSLGASRGCATPPSPAQRGPTLFSRAPAACLPARPPASLPAPMPPCPPASHRLPPPRGALSRAGLLQAPPGSAPPPRRLHPTAHRVPVPVRLLTGKWVLAGAAGRRPPPQSLYM